jgi:23S rRNA (pseudouridine1915-N3)-methyltransferase
MTWRIFAIGKPKLEFARNGIEEYAKRVRPLADVKVEYIKPTRGETESTALLRRSEGMLRIVLDERGVQTTSRELAQRATQWEGDRIKSVALLIGGADGHDPKLKKAADWLWSLGRLTIQHELALLLVMEQLYRAYNIKAGTPYHRD